MSCLVAERRCCLTSAVAAFANAGLLLTTAVLTLVMLQSYITSSYVMEACARAEFLATHAPVGDDTTRTEVVDAAHPLAEMDSAGSPDTTEQASQEKSREHLTDSEGESPCSVPEDQATSADTRVDVGSEAVERESRQEESNEHLTIPGAQPPFKDAAEDQHITVPDVVPWWYQHVFTESKRSANQSRITSETPKHQLQQQNDDDTGKSPLPNIRNRKFEMPELCRIFMGDVWRIMFTFAACCDLYGLTWSIAAVSASSLASDIPILHNDDDYMLYVLIFATIVIPLSFLSIVDQIWIQMAFFGGRMLMVILMLVTVIAAFGASEPHFGDQDGPQATAPLANFSMLSL
jgi:hypothetical protein